MHQNNNEGERVKQQREPQRHLVVKTISVIETKPSYSKFVTVNTDATPLISKTGTKIHQKHKKEHRKLFFFLFLTFYSWKKIHLERWRVHVNILLSSFVLVLGLGSPIRRETFHSSTEIISSKILLRSVCNKHTSVPIYFCYSTRYTVIKVQTQHHILP